MGNMFSACLGERNPQPPIEDIEPEPEPAKKIPDASEASTSASAPEPKKEETKAEEKKEETHVEPMHEKPLEEEEFEPLPEVQEKPLTSAAPVDAAEDIIKEEMAPAAPTAAAETAQKDGAKKKEEEEDDYFADMEPEFKKAPTLDVSAPAPAPQPAAPEHKKPSFAADDIPEEDMKAADGAW